MIDSSALVAILLGEPERDRMLAVIGTADRCALSAAGYVECGIVIDSRRRPGVSRRFDQLLESEGIEIAPLTARQATVARQAHVEYGRGSGHAAKLNLGDCFAYALATDLGEALLFKGDDFGHTDVVTAEY